MPYKGYYLDVLGVGVVRQLEAAHEFAKAALDAPETLLVISLLILGE